MPLDHPTLEYEREVARITDHARKLCAVEQRATEAEAQRDKLSRQLTHELDWKRSAKQRARKAFARANAAQAETATLRARVEECEALVGSLIEEWDAIPQQHYSAKVIEAYLTGTMVPGLRRARRALGGE